MDAVEAGYAALGSAVKVDQAEAVLPDADEFSLSREFYQAYKSYSTFLRSADKQPEQTDLDDLAVKLKAIAFYVARLGLFSKNEELDDISTGSLKFLLVPYMLAEVMAATRDMDNRLQSLRQAIVFWRAFVADCDRLRIAHSEDVSALDRDPDARLDPATKRDEKIARFKRSKELDQKAEFLFGRKQTSLGDRFRWGYDGELTKTWNVSWCSRFWPVQSPLPWMTCRPLSKSCQCSR